MHNGHQRGERAWSTRSSMEREGREGAAGLVTQVLRASLAVVGYIFGYFAQRELARDLRGVLK